MAVIVFIDDSKLLLRLFNDMIGRYHDVTVFEKSDQAIDYIKEHKDDIDIVITDFMMEGHNGLDLLQIVAEVAPDIKKVILTSYYRILEDEEGKEVCDMILEKEILRDINVLNDKIDEVMESKKDNT